MDFFEHQDVARKMTGRLVLLFFGAIVCMGLILYGVLVLCVGYLMRDQESGAWAIAWLNPIAGLATIAALVLIVGGGTLFKIVQLRAGGRVIANHLGGRQIHRNTRDPAEQQLMNVVEEMAIASGTPVPPVYVMDHERGINAFAAGYSPSSAVIGVTRGSIEQLTRAEMQGVIAHEFSHILNGDMRLNIRLIGLIHGILLLGFIGSLLLRSIFYGSLLSGGRRSGGDRRGGDARVLIVVGAIALTLIIIGAVGTFFGTWIKSAISRQREFLADASAVQFTRDPQTIAGALRAIGGFKHRARIDSPYAPEASHMFFGQSITSGFNNIFATHPPLRERIKRVDPSWDGSYEQRGQAAFPEVFGGASRYQRADVRQHVEDSKHRAERLSSLDDALAIGATPGDILSVPTPDLPGAADLAVTVALVDSIGTLNSAQVRHAQSLLESIPGPIREASSDPFSARAVVFGLLLHADGPERQAQLRRLKESADPAVVRALAKILPAFEDLPRELRLPILDICAPELASMTADQARAFLDNARALAEADEQIDPFEWALLRITERRLAHALGTRHATRIDFYALAGVRDQLCVVLSSLARAGHVQEQDAKVAFEHAVKPLRLQGMAYRTLEETGGWDAVGDALETLARVAPRPMKRIVDACARCIAADRTVTPNEAEIFRVVTDALGAPTPPLMPGQPLV